MRTGGTIVSVRRVSAVVFVFAFLASCGSSEDPKLDQPALVLPAQFLLVATHTDATPTVTAYRLDGTRLRSFRHYDMTNIGEVLQRQSGGRFRVTRTGLVPTNVDPNRQSVGCSPNATAATRVCGSQPGGDDEPTITLTRDGATRRVTGAAFPRDPSGRFAGHWARTLLSPDGRTILATWSGECESPSAFLVDVETGGTFSPESGTDYPREAHGLGWTKAGDAVVYFTTGICGSAVDVPGIYLLRPDGSIVRRLLHLGSNATGADLITL